MTATTTMDTQNDTADASVDVSADVRANVAAAEVRVPVVALVGRPNVGKSTLFNRLVGHRAALVHDRPGVTRDRLYAEAILNDRAVRLVDTGGWEGVEGDDAVGLGMLSQTQLAIDEADLVLVLLDSAAGLMPDDRDLIRRLRRANKSLLVVANKVDGPSHEGRLYDLYQLGIDTIWPVSAAHGRGANDLREAICDAVQAPLQTEVQAAMGPKPVRADEPEEGVKTRVEWEGGPIKVAVVGRPNAGKSTLINGLLGEDRLVATAVAGTTRDAVDTPCTLDGQDYVFIDTAGIRRRAAIHDPLEKLSVMSAMKSMERADVALMVFDATETPSEQDAKIAAMAHERGLGMVMVATKWDVMMANKDGEEREAYEPWLRHRLKFVPHVPLLRLSGKTGRGLHKLLGAVQAVQQERHRRVSTAELNRFMREVVETHTPPVQGSTRARIYYVTQPLVRPPTFVFSVNNPKALRESYRRYLSNTLRKRYGFEGTPLWLKFRGRGRTKDVKVGGPPAGRGRSALGRGKDSKAGKRGKSAAAASTRRAAGAPKKRGA